MARFPCLLPTIVLSVCGFLPIAASAQTNPALDAKVKGAIGSFPGKVSLYARNLDTGVTYGWRADDPVPTASTIKLPIMVELFGEVEAGRLDWNEKLPFTESDRIPGSGVLTEFSNGDTFPVRDLMHLMIVVSDNSATDLLLHRIGGDAVNARMAKLGLTQTAVMRQILRGDHPPVGVTAEGKKPGNDVYGTGRSSPREMVSLLEKLYRGELISKTASQEMLTVLKRQRDHTGVGRDLNDTVIASKSGALDHLRSDVAIVYSPHGAVAMAITVQGIPAVDYGVDNQGNLLIAALSQILMNDLDK